MDALIEDYKTYYKCRMDRYRDDLFFTRSYQSEKALYDCVCLATSMQDLMQQQAATFRDLSVQNGVAMVTDQCTCRLQFYITQKETIKAKGQQQVLDAVTTATDALQLAAIVNEIQTRTDIEVLADTIWPTHFFTSAIGWLENIEVLKNAVVPVSFKAAIQQQETESRKAFEEGAALFLNTIRKYTPSWEWNYDLLWQHRHRKKCPLNDVVLQQRIEEHSALVKRA